MSKNDTSLTKIITDLEPELSAEGLKALRENAAEIQYLFGNEAGEGLLMDNKSVAQGLRNNLAEILGNDFLKSLLLLIFLLPVCVATYERFSRQPYSDRSACAIIENTSENAPPNKGAPISAVNKNKWNSNINKTERVLNSAFATDYLPHSVNDQETIVNRPVSDITVLIGHELLACISNRQVLNKDEAIKHFALNALLRENKITAFNSQYKKADLNNNLFSYNSYYSQHLENIDKLKTPALIDDQTTSLNVCSNELFIKTGNEFPSTTNATISNDADRLMTTHGTVPTIVTLFSKPSEE